MFYTIKQTLSQERFNFLIRGILKTPPVPVKDAPWRFLSMVKRRDALMYLLSMKALYRHIGAGRISVMIKRDQMDSLCALLDKHLPGIQIIALEDIDCGACQRGGTWERLVHIIRSTEHEYVIQADCDTLATGATLDEVKRCIHTNTSFAYADNGWSIKTLREIAADADQIESPYVGIALERSFADWPDADRAKYVRASSGFAGFAKGGYQFASLERFHDSMARVLGPRFREWGTEQSGSNYMIANAPQSLILPFPDYATFPLPHDNDRAKFFHFIGSNRFRGDYYASHGRRIIGELIAQSGDARSDSGRAYSA